MENTINTIHLPLWQILAISSVSLLLVAGFLKLRINNHPGKGGSSAPYEPDWSVPSVDCHAGLTSPFHSWDPRFKIVSLFIYCFRVVSLTKIYFAAGALIISLLAIVVSKIPWQRPLKRLLAMAGFLSMFLVVMPFTVPQAPTDTLIFFDPFTSFPFKISGFFLAANITLKACAIALMMEPLLGTAPFTVTIHGLEKLGIPAMICQMLLLAYRYIFVFLHEIKRMARGMRVRGFRRRTNMETIRTIGNFLGMLLVRSFDRTQRVYDAMLSRGYNGSFPTFQSLKAVGADWFKAIFWLVLGFGLLAADRLLVIY